MKWLACLLALVLGFPAAARGDEADAGASHVLTKAPALLKFVQADYPAEAKALQLQGEVVLQIDLDAAGHVSAAEVLQGAGHGFDEAALAAIKQFEFSPAEIDGQPQPVRLQYRYGFTFAPEVDAGPPLEPDGGTAPVEARHLVNFDGRALVRGSRAPLAYAQVVAVPKDVDGGAPNETVSDDEGKFAFEDLAPGTYAVTVVAANYNRFDTEEQIKAGEAVHATYYVRKAVYSAYETVVTGERDKKEVARTTLKQEEIRLIPGTNGDALKVVLNLPGVARAPYGLGLLIVRGSKPYDTRVYLGETLVPQLFHFGGLVSIFNADLLQDITFRPGSFNVDHGRAIGGLITAELRQPSTEGFHGYLNVNVIDTSLLLEGPINKDFSFAVAARRSYIDTVLQTAINTFAPEYGIGFTLAPRYYDYQLRLDWHPKGLRDRADLTVFGSDDRLSLLLGNTAAIDPQARNTATSIITMQAISAKWTHPFSGTPLTSRLHLFVEHQHFDNSFGGDIRVVTDSLPMELQEVVADEVTKELTLEAGAELFAVPSQFDAQTFPLFKLNTVPDPVISRQLIHVKGSLTVTEPAIFVQALWRPKLPIGTLLVVPGIRGDLDAHLGKGWIDPRLAASWAITPNTAVKAAAGYYHQPPNYAQGLLIDKFGNPDLGPEGSQQYMVGLEQTIMEGLSLDLQFYYKWLFDQIEPSTATVTRNGQQVLQNFDNGGRGRSFGLEILLRKQLDEHFFGWISYSLSKSQACSSRFTTDGKTPECTPFGSDNWTTYPFDQPHHLTFVLSVKLPLDFIAGTRIQYSSGNPQTPNQFGLYDADGDIYFGVPGKQLSERAPAYFQIDLRVDKRWVFEKWMLTAYLDLQNVTNRQNVEFVIYNYDFTQRGMLSGLPILPSFGVKGEF